jgi:uncharacterized membrane protein YgdD (TMEM256/DUF423 family)
MKPLLFIGAVFCFLAVVAGALGAHALKELLIRMGGVNNFDLATHYMFYHGLALVAVGILKRQFATAPFHVAGWLFVIGSLLFQGNLYLIALFNFRVFQVLTPVGGICLMAGWLTTAVLALKVQQAPEAPHR